MKYVLEVVYDDTRQECKRPQCNWKGGLHDEPFRMCPVCFHGLNVVNIYTGTPRLPLYPLRDFTDGKYTAADYVRAEA